MKIDYKKELEQASRGMIMIHDPKLLIKLIIRTIVSKLELRHAGMILYEPEKKSYVLSISRGEPGYKIPSGYTKFDDDAPLIRIFQQDDVKPITLSRNAILAEDINRLIWQETVIENGNGVKALLQKVDQQLQTLNTAACVPAFYQDQLMALLLLGEKRDRCKFDQEELDFLSALAHDTAMAIRNAQLFAQAKAEAERNRRQFIQTIMVLGSTIEAKDSYTHGHTERVTKVSLAIAKQMKENGSADFDEQFYENLYIAGMLHDIGKIGVPEKILNKRGKLSDEEYETMKNHTIKGAEMVRPLDLAKESVDGIKYHHERFDGSGYPEGLRGAEIPISAAIIAVADTFDAMTSDRPYRKGMSRDKAIEEIEKKINSQFNPLPAEALLELYHKGEV